MFAYYAFLILISSTYFNTIEGVKYLCGQMKCDCYLGSTDGVVDCYKRNLTRIPKFYTEEVFQIPVLTLEKNDLRKVDRGALDRSVFVSLTTIYLRDNPDLDCQSIQDNIPAEITVITDCDFSRSTLEPDVRTTTGFTTISKEIIASSTEVARGGDLSRMNNVLLLTLCGLLFIVIIVAVAMGVYLKLKRPRPCLNATVSTFELFPFPSSEEEHQDTSV